MRESLKKIVDDPTFSDAFKGRMLTEERAMMEDLLAMVKESRKEAFRRLSIAGSVMDAKTTQRYVTELARFN